MKKLFVLIFTCLLSTSLLANHWTPVETQNNMGVTCVATIDGVELESDQLELGAFLGDECRGSQMIASFFLTGRMLFNLTVYGDPGDEYTFKLYDHSIPGEIDLISPELSYNLDGYGNPLEPYVIAFTTPATTYTVTLTCNPEGAGTLTGAGDDYEENASVTVSAEANEGFEFVNWTENGSVVSPNAEYTFTITANTELVANFVHVYTLDITGYEGYGNGKYYLIASPVTEAITPSTNNGFITEEFDLYYFNQAAELEWVNYDPNSFNIESAKGYLYASKTDTQLKFTGTPYSGEGSVSLVYIEDNPDANMRGWNLIGNPFPDNAVVDRSFYIMNANGDKITPSTGNNPVPAMNGIFVKADSNGESVTFTPGTGESKSQIMLNILKDRSDALDRAIVCFEGNNTLPKFMLNSENTKIYIPQDGQDFAVVNSSRENSIPVSFKAEKNDTYTFNVEMDHVTMEYLHLIDNMTGTDVNLLETPAYSFEARTTDNASRFTLVFRATTGVEENSQRNFCFVNGSQLNFCMDVQGSQVSIIDMAGRTVMHQLMDGNNANLPALSQGVYVVRLSGMDNTMTQKIVIK